MEAIIVSGRSLGVILLLLAMGVSFVQVFTPFCRKETIKTKHISLALLLCLLGSFSSLIYGFVISDFSIENVFKNSHSLKPLIYKISASWGNHEGSILLLSLILAMYNYAFIAKSRLDNSCNNIIIGVQNFILCGFLAFIYFTSNPFNKISPTPKEGLGLNPLLQDIGLAIHPPILYIGYIGLSFALSFSVLCLIRGEFRKEYIVILKKLTLFSWSFLTLGIALGSWWAYRELGWGGFWFWDPVENVSLMPWLCGTAFLHSLIVTQKRGSLKIWTILLGILTFCLTLIGIFLVRSGILTSVHSFASDPQRGLYILIFFAIIALGAFGLFAIRGVKIKSTNDFCPLSKETGILLNNIFLLISCFVVLLGTIYPLLAQIFDESISVGAPYFNKIFNPLALPLLVFAAIVPAINWRKDTSDRLLKKISTPLILGLFVFGFMLFIPDKKSLIGAVAISFAFVLIASMAISFYKRRHNITTSFTSMIIAHIGLAILVIGVAVVSIWGVEKEQIIAKNTSLKIANYSLKFDDVFIQSVDNYISKFTIFNIYNSAGEKLTQLKPEVRIYPIERSNTTESAIYYTLLSNIYLAIGDVTDEGAVVTRIYYKPCINLIWLGSILMFIGGFIGLFSRIIITYDN